MHQLLDVTGMHAVSVLISGVLLLPYRVVSLSHDSPGISRKQCVIGGVAHSPGELAGYWVSTYSMSRFSIPPDRMWLVKEPWTNYIRTWWRDGRLCELHTAHIRWSTTLFFYLISHDDTYFGKVQQEQMPTPIIHIPVTKALDGGVFNTSMTIVCHKFSGLH